MRESCLIEEIEFAARPVLAAEFAALDNSSCCGDCLVEVCGMESDMSFSDFSYNVQNALWAAQLMSLPVRFGEVGWDGYEAEPLSPQSFEEAVCFYIRFFRDFPAPRILVDPYGRVCFKWARSRNDRWELTFVGKGRQISLSVVRGERLVCSFSAHSQIASMAKTLLGWKD